jgi:hypothetical protein
MDWVSKTIVDKFNERFPNEFLAVWRDEPSDEDGRRGLRYTIVMKAIDDELEELLCATALDVRKEHPDFAWSFATPEGLAEDDWPRVEVWRATPGGLIEARPSTGELINALEAAQEAFADLDKVADVVAEPDVAVSGQPVAITVVMRVPMGAPPVALLQAVDRRRKEFIPEHWEVQVAPELNFPPSGAAYEGDGDLELKGMIMQFVEPYRLVEAAWFAPAPFKPITEADRMPRVYLLGEDDSELISKLAQMDLKVIVVKAISEVPRRAKCIFNQITRLMKAEAEGDAETCERIRRRIRAAAAAADPAKVARPLEALPPMKRHDPTTHFTHCRWCQTVIPASSNPTHKDACAECGAYQAATMIPLKKEDVPVMALFINPDNSLFLEFVGTPPVPGRLDLSRTRRYTIPASACEVFDQNPMGKKEP